MNRRDLAALPSRQFGIITCTNCGMRKWTSTIIGMNPELTMMGHMTHISHCCNDPLYVWRQS